MNRPSSFRTQSHLLGGGTVALLKEGLLAGLAQLRLIQPCSLLISTTPERACPEAKVGVACVRSVTRAVVRLDNRATALSAYFPGGSLVSNVNHIRDLRGPRLSCC
jgi:hypothetical protein